MYSTSPFTLVSLLATAATVFAAGSSSSMPQLSSSNVGPSSNAETIACPGVINVSADATVCCVAGQLTGPHLSTCAGWPICTGSATTTVTTGPLSCATVLTWTSGAANSEYSSLLSEVTESLSSSGTHYQTTLGATGGGAAPSSAAATASTTNAPAGTAGSHSASASGTQSSSNGSGVVMAQLGFVAGGLLALAVLL